MQLDRVLNNLDLRRLGPKERKLYINRINTIAVVIEQRFPHVVNSQQIKLHHVQFFRNVWLVKHSSSKRTRQEFMRVLGVLVKAMGHDEKWLGALGITQSKEKGGRPPLVGVKSQKP